MRELTVATFLWKGNRPYFPRHVNALARAVKNKLPVPHRFVVISCGLGATFESEFDGNYVDIFRLPGPIENALGGIQTPEGERFPSSYRRLWILSRAAQELGKKVLMLDIDCVPVGDLTPFTAGDHPFIGWRPRSLWGMRNRLAGGQYLVQPGQHHSIFAEFMDNPHKMIKAAIAAGYRGSDQAILSWRLQAAPHWPAGHGIYQGQDMKNLRKLRRFPNRTASTNNPLVLEQWPLPEDARMVHFNGTRKPWNVLSWPWIEEHFVPYYRQHGADRSPGESSAQNRYQHQ